MTERELRALAAYVDHAGRARPCPASSGRDLPTAPRAAARSSSCSWRSALAVAVAFAVPPARSAILRFFHLRGVRIELVDRLPEVRTAGPLDLGIRSRRDEAERIAGFRPLTSSLLGSPDRVTWDGAMVWFAYGDVRLLVSQFRGTERGDLVKKLAEPRTMITPVSIGGRAGFFISGATHFLYLAPTNIVRDERVRLARNVLLWQRGPLTLRLEGQITLPEALRIARSFR